MGLFIKAEYNFHITDDLRINAIENLWVETQDLIIGVLYKPPNLLNREYLDLFEETLHTIYLSKKKCLIMGDVNINTFKQSNIAKEYLNLVRYEGFNSLTSEATHITETAQTCLDHIHVNFLLPSRSGSIAVEKADHLPVFSIFYRIDQMPFPNTIEFRAFKRLNIDLFKAELNEVDWSPVYQTIKQSCRFVAF